MSANRGADPPATYSKGSQSRFGAEELPDETPRRVFSSNPKSKYKYRPGQQEEEVLTTARPTKFVAAHSATLAPSYEESKYEESFEPAPQFYRSSGSGIQSSRGSSGAVRTYSSGVVPGAVRVGQQPNISYISGQSGHFNDGQTYGHGPASSVAHSGSGVRSQYSNEPPQVGVPIQHGAPVSAVVVNTTGDENMDASLGIETGGVSTAASTEEAKKKQKDRKVMWLVVVLALILVLAIIVGVIVGVVLSKGSDDQPAPGPSPYPTFDHGTPQPTPANVTTPVPTPSPTDSIETDPPVSDISGLVLAVIPSLDLAPYGDPDTPQGRAVAWIEGDSFAADDGRRLQRFALATLYYAMGGEQWDDNANWLSSFDECFGWSHLVCSLSGELLELLLYDDGLVGTIPPEVAVLTTLTYLDLAHSEVGGRLGGTIPTEIGLMTNLTELYLAFMSVTGTIPTEIGRLTNLETFWGFQNRFTEASIPTEIGAATSLTDIRLFRNSLISTVPTEIANLKNLESLIVSTNPALGGTLPAGMSEMTKLTNLNVWGTDIEGALPDLSGLTNLTSLLAWDTSLVGVVPSKLCPNLNDSRIECERFVCDCCSDEDYNECPPDNLVAEIVDGGVSTEPLEDPSSPQSRAVMWLLNDTFSSNLGIERRIQRYALAAIFYATGGETEWWASARQDFLLPSDECQWNRDLTCSSGDIVDRVDLFQNGMNGTMPDDVGLLTALTELDWHMNDITGTIPTTVGLLTDLVTLELHENVMTGPIPTELGLCTKLTYLQTDENELGPSIPTELGLLVHMNFLSIEESNITSTIPSELGLMTNLSVLELSEAQLTGTFPMELEGLTTLVYLDLFGNFLSGPVPDIFSWPNMETLSLESAGLLTGTIPTTLPQLTKLTVLTLGHLDLRGTIPTEIGLMTNLVSLSLSGNSYSQPTIPTELGNLASLAQLWINGASLIGSLPSEIGRLTALTKLHLNDSPNQLEGTIPEEYAELTNLEELGFRNNKLLGTLPTFMGLWTDMKFFYLPGNGFTGGIPTQIGQMTSLTAIILAENENLGGTIPTEIGKLSRLNDIRLYDNGHTGQVPSELSTLTRLTWLSLAPNDITGPLPDLSELTALHTMFLYSSGLTGTVPSSICPNLEVARIDCSEVSCTCCQNSVGSSCL